MITQILPFLLSHFVYAHVKITIQIAHISYYTLYPGETFDVAVGVYWQRNRTAPSALRSLLKTGYLLGSQYIQQANDACTTFNYTVLSLLMQP